ncbi:hypothetical protein D3C85_1915910 [compost metagenome]
MLIAQESEHKIADDDHRQEVRQEHNRLMQLGQKAILDFIQHNRESQREHQIQKDKA